MSPRKKLPAKKKAAKKRPQKKTIADIVETIKNPGGDVHLMASGFGEPMPYEALDGLPAPGPTNEALAKAEEILDAFWKFNARCVDAGFPDLSPWWKDTIAKAYRSGVRNFVVRGGRRGGKSTSVCRVACFEAAINPHNVPEGDVGWFAIISAERGQAKERLQTCARILEKLSIDHHATAEQITIGDRNTGIRCFTASLQGVVSFTSIGALCDEEARWRDKDSGANPAKEVISSLTPTMATQKLAHVWHVSSPWSTIDVHHKMVERGNTPAQIVFSAPTWVMNPTITEADTHALEPDEISWQREYNAQPMSSDESKFFPADHIAACGTLAITYSDEPSAIVAGGDFAFRRDASAAVVLAKHIKALRLTYDKQIRRLPPPAPPLVPSDTIEELAGDCLEQGATAIACDLHYIETVRETTDALELDLLEFPTSPDEIAKAYVRARVLITRHDIDLSGASPELLDQLTNTTSKPGDGATLSIRNPRGAGTHGDEVSAFVAAIWAIDRWGEFTAQHMVRDRRFARERDNDEGTEHNPDWREYAPQD